MIGLIGGSALTELSGFEDFVFQEKKNFHTPYGASSAPIVLGRIKNQSVAFLPRHGESHQWPPHRINYRANLWSLREAGVKNVLALATVGGISPAFETGVMALPDQLVDYTWGREFTLYDDEQVNGVTHIDFTQPYCQVFRERILQSAQHCGLNVLGHGTYAVTQGPRLETAAEIRRLAHDGADMVGMTGMPETSLARELGLNYATLALVVNAAAGQGVSGKKIDLQAAAQVSRSLVGAALKLFIKMCSDGH